MPDVDLAIESANDDSLGLVVAGRRLVAVESFVRVRVRVRVRSLLEGGAPNDLLRDVEVVVVVVVVVEVVENALIVPVAATVAATVAVVVVPKISCT